MLKSASISICVPALNEEKTLRGAVDDLLRTLSGLLHRIEIIIVDDGSTDTTPVLAEQMCRQHACVKVIHHAKRRGVGSCYRDALAIAQCDYFTWFPADHENHAQEFIQCLPYLEKDKIVSCHHRGQDNRTLLRRILSRLYTFALNRILHLDLEYYNGLTIINTFLLRSFILESNGFFFSAESIIHALDSGCEMIELSAPLRERVSGRSRAITLPSLCQTFSDIRRTLTNLSKSKTKKRIGLLNGIIRND